MSKSTPSFDALWNRLRWTPIKNCPGRFRLDTRDDQVPLAEIVSEETGITEHNIAAARDTVLIVRIEGGGIISYRRPDGTHLHTLNTPEGFARKLEDLGLECPGGEKG